MNIGVGMTKSEYTEILAILGGITEQVNELKEKLDKREHIDSIVLSNQEAINGNGKPGLKAIRDKVIAWEGRLNTLSILVIGNIIMQVFGILK